MKDLTNLKNLIEEKREEIKSIKKDMVKSIKEGIKAFYEELKVNTPQLEIDWSTDSETYTTYDFTVTLDDNNAFGYDDWGDWEVYDCDGDEDDEDYFGKEPFESISSLIDFLRNNEYLLGLDEYSDLDTFLENI